MCWCAVKKLLTHSPVSRVCILTKTQDLEQPAVWSHVGIIFVHVQAPAQDTTFYKKLFQQAIFVLNRCRLHSSMSNTLVLATRLITVGDRAFPVTDSRLWNSLPNDVTSSQLCLSSVLVWIHTYFLFLFLHDSCCFNLDSPQCLCSLY